MTALHKAAEGGHVDIVRYLIENEADISIQERIGVSICNSGTYKDCILLIPRHTKDLLAMDLSFSQFVTLTFPDVESVMSLKKIKKLAVTESPTKDTWLVQPVVCH